MAIDMVGFDEQDLRQSVEASKNEVGWTREKLRAEMDRLYRLLRSPEVQSLPFSAPGGESNILTEMKKIQRVAIPKVYKDIVIDTTHLDHHFIQPNDASCLLASAVNVLEALGCRGTMTEKEVANLIGKDGSQGRNIWPSEIFDFLRMKGLTVQELHDAFAATEVLSDGAKVLLPLIPPYYPGTHDVVVSGVKVNQGKIDFYINDPMYKNTVEMLPLNRLIDYITPGSYSSLMPTVAVSRPKESMEELLTST